MSDAENLAKAWRMSAISTRIEDFIIKTAQEENLSREDTLRLCGGVAVLIAAKITEAGDEMRSIADMFEVAMKSAEAAMPMLHAHKRGECSCCQKKENLN
jgi:hypothetical protein